MDPETLSIRPPTTDLASVRVFPLIPALRRDITETIDSALSWDQLTAADINFSIVRPLVNKYARLRNMAVVYATLVVRSYFLSASESDLAFSGVMIARANLAEIMAMKLLSRFAHDYIQLVAVLTTTWNPLVGASRSVVEGVKLALHAHDDDVDSAQSAIEMAISTSAKNFLASPVTQQVVNDIYSGRVVFSVTAHRSILADNYKPRAIEIYNPHNAPFINHYRLRVPKYRTYLDFFNFTLLLLIFVLCLANHDRTKLNFWEVAFIIMGSAFALEEYTASTEHGWIIYIASMWNVFDFSFILVFLAYIGMRIHGLRTGDSALCDMAFDVLACGACVLFPRLAFLAVSNQMIILSLRAMIAQFVFFISIAAICFSGLLFTLWTLANDNPTGATQWTFKSIAWLMVQIWFGNTYLSFAEAASFHRVFGPILMTMFAALANTLLLTILISILSNTVARIDANATQEYLFQYTITTIEGVKSDALFSYQPPFNILAFLILKPLSYTLTPRALHSTNVFLIKLTSLPHLFLIGAYERYLVSASASVDGGGRGGGGGKRAVGTLFHRLPRQIKYMPFVEALVGSSAGELYDAIFELCEDGEGEYSIFGEDAEDGEGGGGGRPALRSVDSRETVADAHVGRKKAGARRSRSRSMNPKSRVRGPAGFDQQQQQPLVNIVSADSEAPSISPVLATTTTTATTRPHPRQRATSAMSPSTPVHHSDYPHVSASGSGTALASTASAGGGGVGAAPAAGAAGAGGAGVTTLSPPDSPSVVLTTERSPLMRLFGSRFPSLTSSTSSASAAQLHGGGVFPPSASNESALNVSTGAGGGAGLSVQTQNLNPNLAAHSHSHSHAQAQAAQAVQAQAAQVTQAVQAAQSTEASVKHIEALLETVGKLPVYKLKEEMKELQDRQARIENLLLMLTRGMRNEASVSATPHRQSTL